MNRLLIALALTTTLASCVVVPVGPPQAVYVAPYGYGHGYGYYHYHRW